MKNKIFLAALATLTLAACSNDEVISVQQNNIDANAITFRTAMTNSRATEVKLTNLDKFWVTALTDGNAYEWGTGDEAVRVFEKNTSETSTDSEAIVYTVVTKDGESGVTWPTYNLKFYASNLDNAEYKLVQPSSADEEPSYVFEPKSVIKDQIDFIYSSNKGNRDDFAGTVPLTFKHALAQIEIKAKNEGDYKIRVKGYRLSNVYGTATFTFDTPQVIGSSSSSVTEFPEGTWTVNESKGLIKYSSETRGGLGYDAGYYADGVTSDANGNNESNHFIEVQPTYTVISGATDEGTAMLIPRTYDILSGTAGNGTHIDLLIQVDDKAGNPVYPATYEDNGTTKRICYRHCPKYYGYTTIPATFDWSAGKKYTYLIDLSKGLGYVDSERKEGDIVDPEKYDPTNDNLNDDGTEKELTEEQGKLPDNTDPYSKGDPILDADIQFVNVTVSSWDPVEKAL